MDKANARNWMPGMWTPGGFLNDARTAFFRRHPDTDVLEISDVIVHPEPGGARYPDPDVNDWHGPGSPAPDQRWKPGTWRDALDTDPHPFRTLGEERALQEA